MNRIMWHKGLTEKLKSYGLSEGLVKWFPDYISNRNKLCSLIIQSHG
jgi:hypothetical protein